MKTALGYLSVEAAPTVSNAGPMVQSARWVQVMPLGEPDMNDGRKFKVTDEDMQIVVAAAAKKLSKGDIPVLFEHGKGPRGGIAAGWFSKFEARADGLWGLVRWLPGTADEIRSDQWRHLSPGFLGLMDEEGFIRPRYLYEVSLTNKPAIHGMARVEADTIDVESMLAEARVEFEALIAELQLPVESSSDATAKENGKNMKEFAVLLGLAETATEEDIKKAIADLQESAKALPEANEKLATVEAELAEAKAALAPKQPETVTLTVEEMEAKVKEQAEAQATKIAEAREAEAKVNALLEQGVREGKITAAKKSVYEVIAKMAPDAFAEVLADLKPVAPVTPVTSGNVQPVNLSIAGLEAQELYTRAAKHAKKYGMSIADALTELKGGK